MDLSCPSNVCNKFIRKNRFWAFLRFGSPLLILRKNEGIITNSCSAIKQARSSGNFDDNYTPLSTIKPQLSLLSKHFPSLSPVFFLTNQAMRIQVQIRKKPTGVPCELHTVRQWADIGGLFNYSNSLN